MKGLNKDKEMKGLNKDNRDNRDNRDNNKDVDHNRDRRDQDSDRQHSKLENKLTKYLDEFLNDVGLTRTKSGIKLRSHADGAPDGKQASWSPAVDIRELDKEYIIIADVPGIGKEDIDIEYNDSLLTISGQNKQDPYIANTQEINIGRDGKQAQPPHPGEQQHYQDKLANNDQRYQQQPTDQRYQQQPTDQRYQQQPTDQRQQQQPTDQQYQQQPTDQHYQQQPTDQHYQQQPTDQHYQQQPDQHYQQQPDQHYQQQPTDQHYQQQPTDQHYQQKPTDQHYQQQSTDQHYQQKPTDQHYQQQSTDRRHPPEEQPQTDQQFQHLSKHRQRTTNDRGERIHIQERPYGYFYRTVQLPNNVQADGNFHANLNNGVLKIRIPKATGNERPRRKIAIS